MIVGFLVGPLNSKLKGVSFGGYMGDGLWIGMTNIRILLGGLKGVLL